MDTPVKTLVNLVFVFAGVFLLLSCLSLYIMSSNARSTMYSVVEYVEINDEDHINMDYVNDYCLKRGLACSILPVTGEGIETTGGKNRYEVQVSFSHVFAWVNLRNSITFSALTRMVDY